MAQILQQRFFLLLAAMLLICIACPQVSARAALEGALDQSEVSQSQRSESNGKKLTPVEGNIFMTENGTLVELFPVVENFDTVSQVEASRRKLGDFLSCGNCNCCDSKKQNCVAGPCCFHINCNVQPYGTCQLVPFTCNCNGCGM